MLPLSRRVALLGIPAFAASPALAVQSLPSDNPDFWSAIARYERVCAQMRAHTGQDDDVLDADLDMLEDAAAGVLRCPVHSPTEALALLTICHFRLYGPLAGTERGFFGEIERLDLEQELTWGEQDRAFLEAAISALKGGC
jgi:hypothetical protein